MSFQRNNAICFLGAWFDACALWRMYIPHLQYPGSGFYIFAGKQGPNYALVAGNDICVVQRCCTPPQFEFIKVVSETLGLKIVYDVDDDVFDLPEYNPAHKLLTQHREGFLQCMRSVDVISVSTHTLAKAIRKHVKFLENTRTRREIPIIVAENRIDKRLFAPPEQPRPGGVLVGWAGSSSHIGDLAIIQKALLSVAGIPGVKIEFRGCELTPGDPLLRLPNFGFKYWTPVAEYAARMPVWGWDIALAPITDHPFNASKSCLKMIEAGYCGIPCLASWVKPYEEFCVRDPELQWLLCAGPSSWEKKLRILVNDPPLRQELGRRMRAVVDNHYSFETRHDGWEEVFEAARR